MKLDELHVGHFGSGEVCHRHPVAGRDRLVRGVQKQLTGAARAEDDGSSEYVARRTQDRIEVSNSDASSVIDDQTLSGRKWQKIYRAFDTRSCDQRSDDLLTG